MLKRAILSVVIAIAAVAGSNQIAESAPQGQPSDWQRFYHYPYVYYPHSFQRPQQYNNLYYRYSPSMRIPVYNRANYNFYPTEKLYHDGAHFKLDVF